MVDSSKSMGYRSVGFSKSEYARTAAATIAYFLALQHDAIGLLTFDEKITNYLPARHRPGHLRRLFGMLDSEPEGRSTDLSAPLEQIAATVKKRAMIVLISDLLAPVEALKTRLGYLRARGHEVIVFRILDPAEVHFTFNAPAMFQDMETRRELYIDPDLAQSGYLERFRAHAAQIKRACDDLGVDLHAITTDSPIEFLLFELLPARMQRSGASSTRASWSRGGRR